MRTIASRKKAKKRLNDLVLRKTIMRLHQTRYWTNKWTTVNAEGKRCESDDPKVDRRSSVGWLQYYAHQHAPNKGEATWSVIFICDRFKQLRGLGLEDISDVAGRDAAIRGLHAVASTL